MEKFETIEQVTAEIWNKLDWPTDKKKVVAMYAFNGSWKTRITRMLNENKYSWEGTWTLSYDALFEDNFIWDNERHVLKFSIEWSRILELIIVQWKDRTIIENFNSLIDSNIQPLFDFKRWEITFVVASWDNRWDSNNIKISRWEESMLIRSIYFTILEVAIEELNTEISNRSTEIFNDLKYITIDDPVSSLDDTKIITLTIRLFEALEKYKNNTVKFLVTSHHILFFNVFVNSFNSNNDYKLCKCSLLKHESWYQLNHKEDDTPFAYHLIIINKIIEAIKQDTLERYHFNLFRWLVEKTANFLWYKKRYHCFWEYDSEWKRLLNIYSHSKLANIEPNDIPDAHIAKFKLIFSEFLERYNRNKND
jgi:hypothetical protein